MIDAKQIPPEVVEALHTSLADDAGVLVPKSDCVTAIAAAINAWPGMFSAIRTEEGGVEWDNEGNAPECLVLPLTQENTDV